jgi:hypothetical protein
MPSILNGNLIKTLEKGWDQAMKTTSINKERLNSIPYQNKYNIRNLTEKCSEYCAWAAGGISVLSGILFNVTGLTILLQLLHILNLALLIAYVVLTLVSKVYLTPLAEYERIGGFIDDGYETTILEKPVDFRYYNNGVAEKGVKRLVANAFKNCYFTNSVSEAMTRRIIITNIVFILTLGICGIANSSANIWISVFQFMSCSVLIDGLIRHLYFRHCILKELRNFRAIHELLKHDSPEFEARAIYSIINYEKALSHYNHSLDSKIFQTLNTDLSDQWEEMKKRYKISLHEDNIH